MVDGIGRTIEYLRISLTDRCNLRCVYCMPEDGVPTLPHGEILRYEELLRLVRVLAGLGVKHLRLTGGEPTVRRGWLDFAAKLHGIPGVESVAMTSNGVLLCDRMDEVKRAGLDALNLSLDTLDADSCARMTRGGSPEPVLRTLEQALAAGLRVKINAVPVRGYNEEQIPALAALAKDRPICVRFIELMPIGCARGLQSVGQDEVLRRLTEAFGPLAPDDAVHGHGPAVYYRPAGFVGSVGVIGALSHAFCASCNRVRLTADGQLKLCLNHALGLDLRALLRGGADDEAIRSAILDAVARKPASHGFDASIGDREERRMNEIGG